MKSLCCNAKVRLINYGWVLENVCSKCEKACLTDKHIPVSALKKFIAKMRTAYMKRKNKQ